MTLGKDRQKETEKSAKKKRKEPAQSPLWLWLKIMCLPFVFFAMTTITKNGFLSILLTGVIVFVLPLVPHKKRMCCCGIGVLCCAFFFVIVFSVATTVYSMEQ